MSATKVDLPARFVTFPARCFVCRRAPETFRLVVVPKGFFIGHAGHVSFVELRVPLCREDAARIRVTRAIAMTLFVIALFGFSGWLFVDGLRRDSALSAVAGTMLWLGGGFACYSVAPQLFDQWLLGVAGVTHREKGAIVRLAFGREEDAREVAQLTGMRAGGRTAPAEAAMLRQQAAEAAKRRMKPRTIALCLALGAIALLFIDESDVQEKGSFSPILSFLAPLVLVLSIGALIDPRMVFALGPNARFLTPRLRLAGRVVAFLGVLAGAALLFYRLA